MKVIITMAGEGSRMKKFNLPKHMVKVMGKTLFEWSIGSLKNFFGNEFIFIARKSHNASKFIEEKCRDFGIKNFCIKEIDRTTKGQAQTVLEAEAELNPDDEIIIYNIDTYVNPKQLKPEDIKGNGWIPAFEAEGDRWSFVKFDSNFKVIEITEKVRISKFGTIGLYYFKSFKLFKECYKKYDYKGEEYIAPLYSLIDDVYVTIVDDVFVLGTIEDIEKEVWKK